MKKIIFTCLALASIIFSGCEKTSEEEEPVSPSRDAAIYQSRTYTPDEFAKFLGSSFDDYCSYLGEDTKIGALVQYSMSNFVDSHRGVVDKAVAAETGLAVSAIKNKWVIRQYNYTYKSVSYTGESITLSAALIVPEVQIKNFKHIIKEISLCPPHMSVGEGFCPTASGTILMGRVFYNHAVVVPDFQGRGVTADKTYSCLHTYDHARQAIDATIAAQHLLKDLGYEFRDGIELYNVGVSEGGEKSYMIQKQIENDITEEEKAALNLKHNFSANGSIDHVQYVKDKIGRVEYTGDQADFESQMEILKTAFECLTEEEKQGIDASVFYSTEILNSDGKTVNTQHPAVLALEQAMERNNITYNWDPKTPLCLAGSHDDTTIKLTSHAIPAYELLKYHPNWTLNTNVKLSTFNTPIVGKISELIGEKYMVAHIVADLICFVHAIENEDPASVDIVDYSF